MEAIKKPPDSLNPVSTNREMVVVCKKYPASIKRRDSLEQISESVRY